MPKPEIPPQAIAAYVESRERLELLETKYPQIAEACGYKASIAGILLAAELMFGQKGKGDRA